MAINGVSVNNANEEHINYDNLENRIASADYSQATNVLTFRDEEGTQKFNVEVEQDMLELDATLSREGYAADAKAVGDEIARVESAIPNVDSTLSTNGDAADAGATGALIVNAMNQVAEGFNDAIEDYYEAHTDGTMWVDSNNGVHVSAVTPDADEEIQTYVEDWLDDHPEATTTVQDGAITYAKLNESLASGLVEDNGTYKYDYNELANIPEPKPSIPLLEKPTMVLKKSFARLTDSDSYSYGQQGAVVTDSYIVLGMNSLGTNADKRNLIYILDKTTYEPATLSVTNPIQLEFTSSTTPTASHANSIAWDRERGEIYVFTMNGNIAIVFDDTTFAEKRREVMPTGGQIGYDNINKQWCFITYASNNSEYSIQIWDDAKQNLIKRVSGSRIGTTQGVLFHDGLIYLPTSVDSSVTTYGGMQNIKVLDTESNLMRSWWFASGVELEDIGLINESTMMIACNSGNNIALYEMQYRSADSISELDAFDVFDLCGRVDTVDGKLVNQHSGADGWSYVLDPTTKFIIAWGRFNVTPTTWTQSDNMLYYSEAFSISTPFTMSNYKYSVLCGGRKLASNPSHGTSNLGFRLQSTGQTTSTVDANIVLVGFIA